jgi:hypothetical protein
MLHVCLRSVWKNALWLGLRMYQRRSHHESIQIVFGQSESAGDLAYNSYTYQSRQKSLVVRILSVTGLGVGFVFPNGYSLRCREYVSSNLHYLVSMTYTFYF